MKFTHLLLALLFVGMPFVALAQEEVVEEQEQQEVPPTTTEEEVASETDNTADANTYVHLVIRRSFVNKTFSETIPALIRVQIFNLGTA